MDLQIQNFDQFIREQCSNIEKYCSSLEPLCKKIDYQDKSITDRLMIKLSLSVQHLCNIAFPTPASAEFFGMPRENTEASDKPDVIVYDNDHPQWDFKPWFQEKVNNIRQGFEGLLEYYEKNPGNFTLAPNAGISADQFIHERIHHDLKIIKAYAEAVLSMFESQRLNVRDVRLEE
jgi:hypothetical protein